MKGARSDKVNHFLQQVTRAGIGKGARSDRDRNMMKRGKRAKLGAALARQRAKAGRGRQR